MSPKRQRKNRDLPPNLYYTTNPRGPYYYYRNPQTGKRTSLGYDKAAAIDAANQVNAHLAVGAAMMRKIMTGQAEQVTVTEYLQRYRDEILPARRVKGHPLSEAYLTECRRILDRFEAEISGHLALADITQAQLAAYLTRRSTAESSNQHRKVLAGLYKHAVSDGILSDNLIAKIVPRDTGLRTRERLSLDDYKEIFAEASQSIKNAMDLSLNALQRRSDIQKWQFKDQRDGFAYVIQSKTRKHGPSAWLRIPLNMPLAHSERGDRTLDDLIRRCRDDIPCPFLVHKRPERVKKSKEKDHPFQLSCKQISDGFALAREACGRFEQLTPAQRPTFHEIIALGEHLRQEQGWTTREIQVLRGHTTERMTAHYLEGHTWTTVTIPAVYGDTKKPR